MQYDYYVASRYRNKDIILPLIKSIREKGKSVYSFIESEASLKNVGGLDEHHEDIMKKFESIPDWQNDPKVKEVFESDMNAIRDSETVILLLPAGKSAHIEAGAAYGIGKKMILIGEQKETESLYLIFDKFYNSADDFLKTL